MGWVPPLKPVFEMRQLEDVLPPVSPVFAAMLARLPVQNTLPEGFDASVEAFEAWVKLLLMDALQRLGFFKQPGEVR